MTKAPRTPTLEQRVREMMGSGGALLTQWSQAGRNGSGWQQCIGVSMVQAVPRSPGMWQPPSRTEYHPRERKSLSAPVMPAVARGTANVALLRIVCVCSCAASGAKHPTHGQSHFGDASGTSAIGLCRLRDHETAAHRPTSSQPALSRLGDRSIRHSRGPHEKSPRPGGGTLGSGAGAGAVVYTRQANVRPWRRTQDNPRRSVRSQRAASVARSHTSSASVTAEGPISATSRVGRGRRHGRVSPLRLRA